MDRNRHKKVCFGQAEKYSLSHCCIPIKSFVKLSSSQVITVNQIFQLVQSLNEGVTLEESCKKTIPERKTQ